MTERLKTVSDAETRLESLHGPLIRSFELGIIKAQKSQNPIACVETLQTAAEMLSIYGATKFIETAEQNLRLEGVDLTGWDQVKTLAPFSDDQLAVNGEEYSRKVNVVSGFLARAVADYAHQQIVNGRKQSATTEEFNDAIRASLSVQNITYHTFSALCQGEAVDTEPFEQLFADQK